MGEKFGGLFSVKGDNPKKDRIINENGIMRDSCRTEWDRDIQTFYGAVVLMDFNLILVDSSNSCTFVVICAGVEELRKYIEEILINEAGIFPEFGELEPDMPLDAFMMENYGMRPISLITGEQT